jgi:hypothetical protein
MPPSPNNVRALSHHPCRRQVKDALAALEAAARGDSRQPNLMDLAVQVSMSQG